MTCLEVCLWLVLDYVTLHQERWANAFLFIYLLLCFDVHCSIYSSKLAVHYKPGFEIYLNRLASRYLYVRKSILLLISIRHLYMSGVWCRCGSKNIYQKGIMCWRRDWTMCSKFGIYSKFNNQHNWGNIYDHLWRKTLFFFMITKMSSYELQNS